ncbi:hypothetical protein H6H01_15825 [Nostoc calcicola FACHB-3891]|nr:hypothetical protein [Nostoc calcicola FACHB-3891]
MRSRCFNSDRIPREFPTYKTPSDSTSDITADVEIFIYAFRNYDKLVAYP